VSEASVDRAAYLRAPEQTASATSPTVIARWGAAAGDTAQSTSLVTEAAASTEVARQLALFGSVMAEDQLLIEGIWPDLEGEVVIIDYTHPGGGAYLGGASSVAKLVVKARVDLNAGTTLLQGLIQL
jgi:hypothetical protein